MKVSLNTIKQYIDFELPPVDELVKRINEQLGGVEEVIDLADKYKDAKIVKVVECDKHPNADKLSVCKIDAGTGELITVVCGAPNVRADMWAIWLPPESIVPSSYDDAEPFKLGARELRGVVSNGMLASPAELAIGDSHDGILELSAEDLSPHSDLSLAPGQSFAALFGLDDTIIDIENKMFTHRPDCFGQLGIAREISGIFGHKFVSPSWYLDVFEHPNRDDTLELRVNNNAAEKVPRFMARVMRDVTVKPSPFWLQCELVRLGSKPINNVVDATNYLMLQTAQPTHAYDYDKLRGQQLGARMAQDGEKITLLNDKTYTLTAQDIVIADSEGPVGLGGVMGGRDSEVTAETKHIVLEVATFDMYTIRKTSMRHGLFTDGVTRFNKGQSPLQNPVVLSRGISYLLQFAGGSVASEVFDLKRQGLGDTRQVEITSEFINERLGLSLDSQEIISLLEHVEFSCVVSPDSDIMNFTTPFWRTDIIDPEDIVEEVGRLYGFDKLPRELPQRSIAPAAKNAKREAAQAIRESLSRAGANEVLTYSFVHENVLKKAEQDTIQAFRLSNALSPDLQYYRLSVLPSLLDKVHMNIKAGHDEFVLFEIGKGHNKKYHADDDDGLPTELEFVDAIYASKKPQAGAAYYHVRRLIQQLSRDLGFSLVYKPITEALDFPVTAPFDQSCSALVETRDGQFIGMIGELKQSVVRSFKLPEYSAAMTLDLGGLQQAYETHRQNYAPLSRFPSITQDISLRGSADRSFAEIEKLVWSAAAEGVSTNGIDVMIEPLSVFAADDSNSKTTSFHLTFVSHARTLKDADIKPIMDHIACVALAELELERI